MPNKNNYQRNSYEIEIVETGQILSDCSMSIRGKNKKNPTKTICHQCKADIEINEQYFNLGDNFCFCLGCVKY